MHFDLLLEQEEPRRVLHKMRTFTGWYTHGLPGGRHLRLLINSLDSPAAFLEELERYFEDCAVAA
jgi:tRNA-dihydrouridine synthase